MRTEAAGEDLAVVGQQLLRGAVAVQGSPEDPADGGGVGPLHQSGHDAEPGVVVDPGHGLELAAVDEPDPPMMSSCHSSIGWGRSQRR